MNVQLTNVSQGVALLVLQIYIFDRNLCRESVFYCPYMSLGA